MNQKLTELKGEINICIIVRDFNITLIIMDKTTQQKISREIEDLRQ